MADGQFNPLTTFGERVDWGCGVIENYELWQFFEAQLGPFNPPGATHSID